MTSIDNSLAHAAHHASPPNANIKHPRPPLRTFSQHPFYTQPTISPPYNSDITMSNTQDRSIPVKPRGSQTKPATRGFSASPSPTSDPSAPDLFESTPHNRSMAPERSIPPSPRQRSRNAEVSSEVDDEEQDERSGKFTFNNQLILQSPDF